MLFRSDAGTGLLSPISYALQRGILLRRENPTYRYWAPVAAARHGLKMVLIQRELWEHLCRRYMRSTECHSSLKYSGIFQLDEFIPRNTLASFQRK